MKLEERLNKFLGQSPDIDPTAFIHPDATVLGAVRIQAKSSVWPRAVLRGDINSIHIGTGTNIQDGAVVHLADESGVTIGDWSTVGHLAIIHACRIGSRSLIGMHATILDGAIIGDECIIGANSLVTQSTTIPEGSLVFGSPAKVIRSLNAEERASIRKWAEKYIHVAQAHRDHLSSGTG